MMVLYLLLLLVFPTVNADIALKEGCSKEYICFAPKDCQKDEELREMDEIKDDCFVFIKFHPYSPTWFRVVMASFGNAQLIELYHSPDDTTKKLLTCKTETEGGKQIAKAYKEEEVEPIRSVKSQPTGKLNCEFEVDRVNSDVDGTLTLKNAIIKTDVGGTSPKRLLVEVLFCMPNIFLEPALKFEAEKKYEMVQYHLTKVKCDHPDIFTTIQYRSGNGEYVNVKSLQCEKKGNKCEFQLVHDDNKIDILPRDEDIDVRCVADAAYFCDYEPKGPRVQENIKDYQAEKVKLTTKLPDITTNPATKGRVECPKSHPLFVIKGGYPTRDFDISCMNHNGRMRWTLNGNTILSSTGPEVHCVNKLECHVWNKLNATHLKGSYLSDDFLPRCQDDGTLQVTEGSAAPVDANVTCDGVTGKYNYHTGNGISKEVTSATEFSCKYEEIVLDVKSRQQTSMLAVFLGISAVFAVLSIVISCCIYKRMWRGEAARRERMKNLDVGGEQKFDIEGKKQLDKDGKIVEDDDETKARKKNWIVDVVRNDYLENQRLLAETNIQVDVIPVEFPRLNRAKSLLSEEAKKHYGERPGGERRFIKYRPVMSKNMQILKDQLDLIKKEEKDEKLNERKQKENDGAVENMTQKRSGKRSIPKSNPKSNPKSKSKSGPKSGSRSSPKSGPKSGHRPPN